MPTTPDNVKLRSLVIIASQHKDPSRSRYTDTRIVERSHIIDKVSTRVNSSPVYLHAGLVHINKTGIAAVHL
jgi:hypothetical protein